MKKGSRNRKIWGLLALLLCASLTVPAVHVQAVSKTSKKAQAIKAYKQFLSGKPNNGGYDFAVLYLDNDAVPELMVGAFLYTFKNGTVAQQGVAFGDSGCSYYKKKGVIVTHHTHKNLIYREGLEGQEYSKFTKSGLTRQLYKDCRYTINSSGRAIGKKQYSYSRYTAQNIEKKASKSRFNAILKQMVGRTKATRIKMHHNTAANRNRYLK